MVVLSDKRSRLCLLNTYYVPGSVPLHSMILFDPSNAPVKQVLVYPSLC